MATGTLGTNANNSFTALRIQSGMAAADVATLKAAILKDNQPGYNKSPATEPQAFNVEGLTLFLPGGRGRIQMQPGDVLAVDPTTGWPIVISKNCATNGAVTTTV